MELDDKQITRYLIGVDLGGTNIRSGKVAAGEIIDISKARIPKTDQVNEVMEVLFGNIRQVFDKDTAGIGIGVPGLVDHVSGMVYELQNIPAWKNIKLAEILEKEFNVPVYLDNDANCFAAGECFFGQGKKFSDFVGLITGTGLGAGIISRGELISGRNCGAGEFGVIPYLDQNLEFYASGNFFKHFYNRDTYFLAEDARNGDSKAQEIFLQYGKHLGKAIKVIVASLNPQAIILGGGVSNTFELYQKSMWEEINTYSFKQCVENLIITPSQLPEVAILGAAALYHNASLHKS